MKKKQIEQKNKESETILDGGDTRILVETRNLRGTFEGGAMKHLSNDCSKYKLDIVAIQKSKQKKIIY